MDRVKFGSQGNQQPTVPYVVHFLTCLAWSKQIKEESNLGVIILTVEPEPAVEMSEGGRISVLDS